MTAPSVARSPIGHGAVVLCWAGLGIGLGLLAAVAVPTVLGYRSFTVMSGSMEPAVHTGDLVVTRPIRPEAARVGDVVTFQDPHSRERTVTHRVRSVRVEGAEVRFETKGDANNASERWSVRADGRVGRVTHRLVKLGYAFRLAGSPWGRIGLIGVPTVALGILVLVSIWRPARPVRPKAVDPALADAGAG